MTRQTNINEARLIEENQRWETHWTFLRDWMVEYRTDPDYASPARATANRVVEVMDELRQPPAEGEGYRQAWHALWQELTTVGDGIISGEDVIKMMSRIEEDKLPPMEGDEQ